MKSVHRKCVVNIYKFTKANMVELTLTGRRKFGAIDIVSKRSVIYVGWKGTNMSFIQSDHIQSRRIVLLILSTYRRLSEDGARRSRMTSCHFEVWKWVLTGKGRWFQCEQLFLSGERCVTSPNTATKDTTAFVNFSSFTWTINHTTCINNNNNYIAAPKSNIATRSIFY